MGGGARVQGEKMLGKLGPIFSRTWKPKKGRAIAGPLDAPGEGPHWSVGWGRQSAHSRTVSLTLAGPLVVCCSWRLTSCGVRRAELTVQGGPKDKQQRAALMQQAKGKGRDMAALSDSEAEIRRPKSVVEVSSALVQRAAQNFAPAGGCPFVCCLRVGGTCGIHAGGWTFREQPTCNFAVVACPLQLLGCLAPLMCGAACRCSSSTRSRTRSSTG